MNEAFYTAGDSTEHVSVTVTVPPTTEQLERATTAGIVGGVGALIVILVVTAIVIHMVIHYRRKRLASMTITVNPAYGLHRNDVFTTSYTSVKGHGHDVTGLQGASTHTSIANCSSQAKEHTETQDCDRVALLQNQASNTNSTKDVYDYVVHTAMKIPFASSPQEEHNEY